MLKSTAPAPTRRECVLLGLLLLALLWWSKVGFGLGKSRASLLVPERAFQNYNSSAQSIPQDLYTPTTESERWRTLVTWSPKQILSTVLVSHVPGWTIFENLYVLNGTIFVVTDDPESIPDRKTITSTGVDVANGALAVAARVPTDREFRVISPDEAQLLFGSSADLIDGTTWMVNDPPQFIKHYYHWSAELFFGFWRTYSSLDPSITSEGSSSLPAPRRAWFVHTDADHWRDYASLNQWILRAVFPSIIGLYSADWQDRAQMGRPMFFDRVIFTDRAAAMNGEDFIRTERIASEAFALPGSVHWWSVVRTAVTRFTGFDEALDQPSKPVITYVSRQDWVRRKLIQADHDKLVEELYKLRDQHGVEVNVVSMDTLTHAQQLGLAARTTIMMGVHGNALTSLVWMKPTPQSTVIEFFYPEGFARDYQYTAEALGMVHYGVWNDKTFTSPDLPKMNYPEGFQGNNIPLHSKVIAKLCAERLQLPVSTEAASDSETSKGDHQNVE